MKLGWYKNCYRRNLVDMHIEDWSDEFLSEFNPEEYVENLKRAKVQSAMLYFQSHVGLCYFPTKVGKMHNAFVGKEDMMKRVVDLCHEAGIAVVGYYSVIYNNYEHDRHPEWRALNQDGKSERVEAVEQHLSFGSQGLNRYGYCCPNNMEYREFVKEQIREMLEYFDVDGMFYDMLFWTHPCYCEECRKRWEAETKAGKPRPVKGDANWHEYDAKLKEWMGEFAKFLTDETKKYAPDITVEHNYSASMTPSGMIIDTGVCDYSDYTGGDLYLNAYSHSFACKYYRSVTKNQPFEYMTSRCDPSLYVHTTLKSEDMMSSEMFLTVANHGAMMIIDAIDPVGTLDARVYDQIGTVFEKQIPYEPYMDIGKPIEDVGIFYSLNKDISKYQYTNHLSAVVAGETFLQKHVCYGVVGTGCDISRFQTFVAPMLIEQDGKENARFIEYVKNGGNLYISGVENVTLLQEFFGAKYEGQTRETIVYIAPEDRARSAFGRFNKKYPLHFDSSAPKLSGIKEENVLARITLPYTPQDVIKFASIHSNPPGIPTEIPAMAVTTYGKGKVLWSAFPIETMQKMAYKNLFYELLKQELNLEQSIRSDAPYDVEVTGFQEEKGIQICAVLLNEHEKARKVEDFQVTVKCSEKPSAIVMLPENKNIPFEYEKGEITFTVASLDMFAMYQVKF